MSNIFAPYCRWNRRVPVAVGEGPIAGPTWSNQHLILNDEGQIHCALGAIIHHWGAALPFDENGRLIIAYDDVAWWDQGIPFTAAGFVAVQEDATAWTDQGVGFTSTGHVAVGVESIVVPGEYFRYYNADPGDVSLTYPDMGLVQGISDVSVQMVVILKEDLDPGVPDLSPVGQVISDVGNSSVVPMHNEAAGGLAVVQRDFGLQDQTSHVYVGTQGSILDIRFTVALADGLTSWVDKLDMQTALFTLYSEIFNNVEMFATYYRPLALRVVRPNADNADVLAWPEYTAPLPTWGTIPDKLNFQYELPQDYDVAGYVSGSVVDYQLVTPPAGFTVDSNGIITADGAAVAAHVITVRAITSDFTQADVVFTWEIQLGNAPTWDPIPNQSHRVNVLPQTLDVAGYANSDSGPITDYSLVTPPAGFSISGSVITASAGTAVAAHVITVRATNGVGATDTTFNWDILEELIAPVWGTIPDQLDIEPDLPVTLDTSTYVTSNAGTLRNWALVTPPPGFSIDQTGLITVAAGTALAVHNIVVQVENDIGSASTSFTWTISAQLLPPQWSVIPGRTTGENLLPSLYDVSGYASSNSGPLTGWALAGDSPAHPSGLESDDFNSNSIDPRWTFHDPIGDGSVAANGTHLQISIPAGTQHRQFGSANDATRLRQAVTDSTAPFEIVVKMDSVLTGKSQYAEIGVLLEASPNDWVRCEIYWDGSEYFLYGGRTQSDTTQTFGNSPMGSGAEPRWLKVEWDGAGGIAVSWSDDGVTFNDRSVSAPWLHTITTVAIYAANEGSNPAVDTLFDYFEITDPPAVLSAPAGFSIDANGVITAADTVDVGTYPLTVEVSNDTGTSLSDPFDWEITLFYLVPQWSVIPAQSTGDLDLPVDVDISSYVTSNSGPLVNWSLVTPPTGFSISQSGVITVAAGTAITTHSVTVRVENDEGPADSAAFSWQIFDVPEAPSWSTVPNQSHGEDNLPQTLDMKGYVTSNSGALTGWQLVSPVAGFSLDANGILTLADGTAPNAGYSLQVQVTNDTGTTVSNIFSWEVLSVYLVPQWSAIPAQSTEEQVLPVVLDVKPYVTSNHGSLTGWSLVSPPGGWTIDSSGVITVAAGRTVDAYAITVRVSNDSGSADSAAFTWNILEEPLPPQWSTIPNKQTRENLLPQVYDVSSYVTSNSGALTGWSLVSPPTGFTISGAGVITAAAGTTVAIHSLTVRVSNDSGTEDSASFTWEVQEELLPPQWDTVPDRQDRINTLPQPYDMTFYCSSNSGNLILWKFDSAPAGFSINGTSGVITATAAAGVAVHQLQVNVTNSSGASSSNIFDWEIQEELLVPQWSAIPNQTDPADSLPQTLDVTPYVTTNSGPLVNWQLVSPPSGFSISAGVVTCASGTAQADHQIKVRVTNDTGTSDSAFFTWTVEPPAVKQYYHEFNASLDSGFWTFARNSLQTGMDNTTIRRQVGSNVPAYPQCGWGGSSFTPNASFRGILLEGQATNQFWWSTKFFPSNETNWKWNGGWGTKSPVNQGRESSMNQVYNGNQITTHTYDARSDDGPGREMGFSPDNGGIRDFYVMDDGTYLQMQHTYAARSELIATMLNGESSQDWSYDWWQLETGNFGTSQIETQAATGTRARTTLDGDIHSEFTQAEMTQDWAMQFKFSMENDISKAPGAAWGVFYLGDGSSVANSAYGYVGSTYVAFTVNVGGTNYSVTFAEAGVAGIKRLDEIDLRVKWTSTGLTAWLKYPGQALYKKVNATALSAWATRALVVWGLRLEAYPSSSANDMPGCLKAVRVEAPAPADVDIEAWT